MGIAYLEFIETDITERLKSLKGKLDRDNYDNLVFEITKNTFQNIVYDFKRYFYEKLFSDEYRPLRNGGGPLVLPKYNDFISGLVNDCLSKAKNANSFEEVVASIDQLLGLLSSFFNDRQNAYHSDTMRDNIGYEGKTPSTVNWNMWMSVVDLKDVVAHITTSDTKKEYRLLDTAIPHEKYKIEVKDDISIASENWQFPVTFYGVSNIDSLSSEKYRRIVAGKAQEIKITPKSFDVVHSFLPLTASVYTDTSVNVNGHDNYANQTEILRIRFLSTVMKTDGILILHMPLYSLSSDLCYELAKRFTNFSVFKDEFSVYNKSIITLVATRRSNNETSGDIVKNDYNVLRNIVFETEYDPKEIKFKIPDLKRQYVLSPKDDNTRKFIFRGHHLSEDDIKKFVMNDNFFNKIYKSEEAYFDRYEGKHPLLPFTNGQLGLVLVSGFLDGIIEEDNGHCHIVKGRSSKHATSDVDFEDDKVILHRNYSNKIEINMFEPDGTYKNLV